MPFSFVPAAYNPNLFNGLAIYTKYLPYDASQPIELLSRNPNHCHFRTPDRELFLVRNMHETQPFRPMDSSWDEITCLGLFSNTAKSFNLEHVMTNYTHSIGKEEHYEKCRNPYHYSNDGIQILADSGGLQLLTQSLDFIDPVKLAKWYDNHADLGMSLDLPCYATNESLLRSAYIQKKNNDLMLDNMQHAELINIIHGNTLDVSTYYKHLKIVHDDRIKRLAFGIHHGTVMDALYCFISLMEHLEKRYPDKYMHVHILGVYNNKLLLPLIYLANSRFKQFKFTSDSSTHLQRQKRNIYLYHSDIMRPHINLKLGYTYTPNYITSSASRLLPCSCPVCSQIKYSDIFAYSSILVQFFHMVHNLFSVVEYARFMDEMARKLSFEDYRTIAISHITRDAAIDASAAKTYFSYVETYLQEGLKKANSKHQHWLSGYSLFQTYDKVDGLIDEEDDLEEEPVIDLSYQEALIVRYEKYHENPEKFSVKNKKKTSITTRRVGNTARKQKKKAIKARKRQ